MSSQRSNYSISQYSYPLLSESGYIGEIPGGRNRPETVLMEEGLLSNDRADELSLYFESLNMPEGKLRQSLLTSVTLTDTRDKGKTVRFI